MTAEVVFHLATPDLAPYRDHQGRNFYPKVHDLLQARGASVRLEQRQDQQMEGRVLPPDGHLHIVETGWCSGPGWMSAATAYLAGFWHLSDVGVLANSPAQFDRFDASKVPLAAAQAFAADLRARFSDRRQSRYRQHRRAPETLPAGAIAVFLQGPGVYRRKQAHVSALAMLSVVANHAQGRPVVVKAHPLAQAFCAKTIAKARAAGCNLIETEANVHDILSRAAVSVSVNSAAAIEGFLHGVPAVLFGQSDFGTLVETVGRAEDYPQALTRALGGQGDYDRMLYWYFDRHALWTESPKFEARLLATLANAGFDARVLGMTGPV